MSFDRWKDTRIERAAVLATEQSVLENTDFITALPATDFGIDLLVFRPEPFAAAPIQVKGAQNGLKVFRKHADMPLLLAYVIAPLSEDAMVSIMTGEDAWQLPVEYVERGGRAGDYSPHGDDYRWPRMTKLLASLFTERIATAERWELLFEEVRAR